MKLEEYFTGIVFKPAGGSLGKTQRVFYEAAMIAAKVKNPHHVYFVEDGLLNVFMALNCRWKTVLYNGKFHPPLADEYAAYQNRINRIVKLNQLPKIYPNLFTYYQPKSPVSPFNFSLP